MKPEEASLVEERRMTKIEEAKEEEIECFVDNNDSLKEKCEKDQVPSPNQINHPSATVPFSDAVPRSSIRTNDISLLSLKLHEEENCAANAKSFPVRRFQESCL